MVAGCPSLQAPRCVGKGVDEGRGPGHPALNIQGRCLGCHRRASYTLWLEIQAKILEEHSARRKAKSKAKADRNHSAQGKFNLFYGIFQRTGL